MFKKSKLLNFCTASIVGLMLGQGQAFGAGSHNSNTKTPLQDPQKVIHFFQEEISFKTNPHSVKESIDNHDTSITIIDVRSAKDYAAGHIPGAINIPYDQHKAFLGDETKFKGLRKDTYNVVYCYELLCNLAKQASIKFASLGYPVKEMAGGYQSWKEKGHPIEK